MERTMKNEFERIDQVLRHSKRVVNLGDQLKDYIVVRISFTNGSKNLCFFLHYFSGFQKVGQFKIEDYRK
jgi:hypothetical protein